MKKDSKQITVEVELLVNKNLTFSKRLGIAWKVLKGKDFNFKAKVKYEGGRRV